MRLVGPLMAKDKSIEAISESIGSTITTIKEQWTAAVYSGNQINHSSMVQIEGHVRRLWQYFYDSARFHGGKYKDELVVEFLLIHGMGDLVCQIAADEGSVISGSHPATLSRGVLWSDLPFFVEDIAFLWSHEGARISRAQRKGLHSFLATVGGVGIHDKLCGLGIMVLREAVETDREMGDYNNFEDPEDEQRVMSALTVADLLDSARCWLVQASDRFEKLVESRYADFDPETGRLGPLAVEAGVPDNNGFSIERLEFWRRRVRNIVDTMIERPEGNEIPSQERWPDSLYQSWQHTQLPLVELEEDLD
jgi:hypothetical protein